MNLAGAIDPNTTFQLYRRRSSGQPWEKVSRRTPSPVVDPNHAQGLWPISSTFDSSFCYNGMFHRQANYYDLGPDDFCPVTFEYAVSSISDPNDVASESDLSASVLFPPAAAIQPLPVPENLTSPGDGRFTDPMTYDSPPGLVLRWDGYKAACVGELRGYSVFRGVVGATTGLIEVTDSPTTTPAAAIGRDALPHLARPDGLFDATFYAQNDYAVKTVGGAGAASRFSNVISVTGNASQGTCLYYYPLSSYCFHSNNVECSMHGNCTEFSQSWNPHDPNTYQAPDPNVAPGVSRTGWGVIGINAPPGANRVHVYRETGAGASFVRTLVAAAPGDEKFYSIEGWGAGRGAAAGTTAVRALPHNACGEAVTYRVSAVDHLGHESVLSAPVPGPAPFDWNEQLDVVMDENAHLTVISWPAVGNCGGLRGYNVYRADIPNAADCYTWQPTPGQISLRTATPVQGTSFSESHTHSGNIFKYWVRAVGTPGDPNALSQATNPVCVADNGAMLNWGPSETDMPVRVALSHPATGQSSTTATWVQSPERLVGQAAISVDVLYYHTDHLGSPVLVTDSNGTVLSRHKYLPFGEEMQPAGLNTHNRRFTGHERDVESGLDYMLARYYSASSGRFLSVDPFAPSASLKDPQSWNRFSYSGNNPVRYIDPLGLYQVDGDPASVAQFNDETSQAIGFSVYQDDNGDMQRAAGPPTQDNAAATAAFDAASGADFTIHVVSTSQAIVDRFGTQTVNPNHIAAFPLQAPKDAPQAVTRGEVVTHILGEYTYGANVTGFSGSGAYNEAHSQGGLPAQNACRDAHGQSPITGATGFTKDDFPFNWLVGYSGYLTMFTGDGHSTRIDVVGPHLFSPERVTVTNH
ncbi:MAG: hypothetical protein HY049_10090 [Acidobacteria bacterium]|nr:hypothetical protein [Acidobacteriota bacterium]